MAPRRVQLQVSLPYKFQPTWNPKVKRYLDDGYTIEHVQRLSDNEAVVTLTKAEAATETAETAG